MRFIKSQFQIITNFWEISGSTGKGANIYIHHLQPTWMFLWFHLNFCNIRKQKCRIILVSLWTVNKHAARFNLLQPLQKKNRHGKKLSDDFHSFSEIVTVVLLNRHATTSFVLFRKKEKLLHYFLKILKGHLRN